MRYRLEWDDKAKKQFKKLDPFTQKQLLNYLERYAESENPRSQGYGLKHELSGIWRYDVGAYRILCEIEDEKLVVIAVKVGHRKEIYKR